MSFLCLPLNRVPGVMGPRNGAGTRKQCGIAHETASFYCRPLKPCIESHVASKLRQDPKTVWNSPRNSHKMRKR
jgi:hypothetical protein